MCRTYALTLALLSFFLAFTSARAEQPKPSPYPVSWELKFDNDKPVRIVVDVPGKSVPEAFWYLPYKVTNNTGQERMFLPIFELADNEGKITRSDNSVSPSVIEAIRKSEGNRFIQSSIFIAGELRLGNDETKYGVAVWPASNSRMGRFSILAGGLSGEFVRIKDTQGKEVTLRKTRQMDFHINGEEVLDKDTAVKEDVPQWIMH